MDAIFALAPGPRARAMGRAAARVPGCLYLFLWAPAAIAGLQPNHMFCLDAWIGNGGGGDRALELFEAYRGALCAAVSGCVPGWAYKEGAACMELPEPDLTASASLQVQQQFYQEAGTKMAVFMGCESGEIEVGLSDASATVAAAVANEVQQSILEELFQMPPPSSSSSSLLSLSVGSPEYSSLVRSMATSVTAAATTAAESVTRALPQQPSPLPSPMHGGLLAPVYGEFPSSDDDAAMAQAMLAIISTSSPPSPPWHLPRRQAHSSSSPRRATAFKAYNAALSPRERPRPRPGAPGQRMIKTGISLLAGVHLKMRSQELAAARRSDTRAAPPPPPPPPPSTSSQLNHMISERRRRERINDSFQSLRALLPPGSKKDKAAVLASTTAYMDKLISQVSELEEKNQQLEAQLAVQSGEAQQAASSGGESSSERVQVDVAIAGSSASMSDQPREASIRVTVRAECDVSEVVVAVLARLREMGRFAVVSVDARQRSSSLAQASLTLRVTAGDVCDETSLKEAMAKAVVGAVTTRPSSP
ncbi:hypothetical protein E2562_034747 [Oryza meyeriana var. granulata]|uniref:BHLH domain-containing protein n=1 Tax=Oryza meyeriana var. granulata TaxID=110450 RepID=A0A6G1CVG4_9ORYZ|nr:hypothetical protein E2562_034747 [Oryza meyeriana var. granulata]